jgi:dephospho-CoA kinase
MDSSSADATRTLSAVLVIGLTGGIGAGKSEVAALLAKHDATVIDVDALGRQVLEPTGAAHHAVVARFGPAIVARDGSIDRSVLAGLVFGDEQALADLTAISHPAIDALLAEQVAAARVAGAQVVVLDMAVLVESKLGRGLYDKVVVVEAPWLTRLARLRDRGLSTEEAEARDKMQATDAERRAVADEVILNDGDLAGVEAEVERVWRRLVSPSAV